MNKSALARLDSFPYAHRIAEVMSAPLITLMADASVVQATECMTTAEISAVVTLAEDGTPVGILTERDVLRLLTEHGADGLSLPLHRVMSHPIVTVRQDAFLYVALGRMARLDMRHLVVVDQSGRAVGMVSGRAMLKLRAQSTLQLGDALSVASDAPAMDAVRGELPKLVGRMLSEDVPAHTAAAVISAVYCEMTARAAELAEQELIAQGRGTAPCRWCVLVLGSGGRAESLLAPDQDNAIIYQGDPEAVDKWFADLATRMNEILDQAGLPFCKGGVMAKNANWRRTLDDWKQAVDQWLTRRMESARLVVDIFYDFIPVLGDASLAAELRDHAIQAAQNAPRLMEGFSHDLQEYGVGLNWWGGFQKEDNGRINLKAGGLLPLVFAARCLALRHGCSATGTLDRLADARERGLINRDLERALENAQQVLMATVLEQQNLDTAAGRPPSSQVEPKLLGRHRAKAVKTAMRDIEAFRTITLNDLASQAVR
ncbi:MAG: DUF294 nucleotidyltransferase-like domain-containing protein [Alphaproteobacteria bacterium]|nr:DUF294 nucleotidyltransferase-like domain-containing protein [Alphaproteobacteria bacterium]